MGRRSSLSDQVSSVDSLIGLELSHYRIIEKIGSGGMGVVYRARDAHLDREVAIKVLTPGTITGEVARKHLRKEALALSKLNHPNIATVYDFADGSQRILIANKMNAPLDNNTGLVLKGNVLCTSNFGFANSKSEDADRTVVCMKGFSVPK